MRFPEITVSGTPDERGFAHGEALSSEIEATINFYATIFKKSSGEIFERANHFRNIIQEYNPAFCEEIEGIAAGAKIREPLWIYALNSRSEILAFETSIPANECTAICFQPAALLGQTWDWASQLEKLAVLMQIEMPEGHRIQMLTEPGIIGKIGLNSKGMGACLNILMVNKPLNGVPVHIVLRAILESKSLEEAKAAVQRSGCGKASHILFGDQNGVFCGVEFAGDELFFIQNKAQYMVHTNHYLMRPINPDGGYFSNSYARFRVADEKTSSLIKFSIDEMKTILTDRSDPEFPIWQTYRPDNDLLDAGTVATIVMDLKKQQLHIRKGNANNIQSDFTIAFEN